MYAASAWAPATTKLGVRKQLNVVQRGFAQKLCRAYRTVSLNSALALSGLLPLDLRIQEALALYEAKRGALRPELGDSEMERMAAYAQLPHPARHMDLQLISLVDQSGVDTNNTQAVRIFTDGSKIEGKVGASLSLWDNDAETRCQKFKLSSYCSVYQAELLAISKATEEILARPEESFGIYSDSMSALQTLANWCAAHPLAVAARRNILASSNQGKTVQLFWVKAHVNVRENERADELAKEAALRLKTKPMYDRCPVSFIKRQIRLGTIDEWNRRYVEGQTASVTKFFLPDVTRAHKTVRHLGVDSVHTQILTGHGGFSEYLHRFKCKENPSCICDPAISESVLHILFECPTFARIRNDAEGVLRVKVCKNNIETLMKKHKIEKFMFYCRKIVKVVINRNKR